MKESELSSPKIDAAPEGFQISKEPVISAKGPESRAPVSQEQTSSRDADLLYVIARDPRTLFVYWDVNWRRLFERAGHSPRQVYLRIYRQDGSVEDTREINPFLDYYYASVANSGAGYRCELGCFEREDWTGLVSSGLAITPADHFSNDLSAQFATLPFHLSFQRMLDSIRESSSDRATLAKSVGKLQEDARVLRQSVSAEDWERMVKSATTASNGHGSSDLETLLRQALREETPAPPTAERLAAWERLAAPRGGASQNGFGGSSPA